jgi:hypothetical protein
VFQQRRASQLVELFGLDYTAEGIREVDVALAHVGLAPKPALSADKPNRQTVVVIVGGSSVTGAVQVEDIEVWTGEPGREYRVLGPLKARVTAATIFSKTPTVEDVNLKLREQATRLGANAVINVTYSRGPSATSWKALTAEGTGVVVDTAPTAPNSLADPLGRIGQLADLLASGAITENEYAEAKRKLLGAI